MEHPEYLALAGGGVVAGIALLVRGFLSYGSGIRVADTAPSRISSIAVGEVLVSGIVEPAEVTLVSPLQSEPCVYYRSAIGHSDGDITRTTFDEERAVGFRLRDETGDVRVFPRAARFDVPDCFDERDGSFGEGPPGLRLRYGSAYGPGTDRESQVAALLSVHPAAAEPSSDGIGGWSIARPSIGSSGRGRTYHEARIAPGEIVTIVGRAMPFDQLVDPTSADVGGAGDSLVDDPEIAADMAEARAAGLLADDAEDAWGNAAIPGFGIGRPVREPELDPAANEPPLATPDDAARNERTFGVRPDALVLAASDEVPLIISLGTPMAVAGRSQRAFLIGLLGAILAIGSAMALALLLGGQLG